MSHRMLLICQPFQVLTSCLVFVGVCGNISSEEKNSTASSDTFCTDILNNGCQGRESAHTHDQDRNARGAEMDQVQSSSPRQGPPSSPLWLKILIFLFYDLESRRKRIVCRIQWSSHVLCCPVLLLCPVKQLQVA